MPDRLSACEGAASILGLCPHMKNHRLRRWMIIVVLEAVIVVLEAVMHRKLRRRIANAIMVIIIIGVIAAGIWFTGSVMDWWA